MPGAGRTFIQITWQSNYALFGQWCHAKGLVDDPDVFVNDPTSLSDDKWAWLGPVWYWTAARPQLNGLSDQSDLVGVTRSVNGGLNGFDDRLNRYNACLTLGQAILPDPGSGRPGSQ